MATFDNYPKYTENTRPKFPGRAYDAELGALSDLYRRGLWYRPYTVAEKRVIELYAGREGDDARVLIEEGKVLDAATMHQLLDVLDYLREGYFNLSDKQTNIHIARWFYKNDPDEIQWWRERRAEAGITKDCDCCE